MHSALQKSGNRGFVETAKLQQRGFSDPLKGDVDNGNRDVGRGGDS